MALEFPDIDPVAFAAGPLEIRWYALAYLAGFILGWRYCLYIAGLDKREKPGKTDIDEFLPWAILGVIIGGRIGYVFIYQPGIYMSDPLEALKIWHGGMSFHGGLLGAVAAMLIYCKVMKIPVLRLADMFAAAAPIGLFFGRIANFVNGELFGRVTAAPWGVVFPHGGALPRHPSQLYEAVLEGLVLFVILFLLVRKESVRNRPGMLSGVFLIGYGLARGFVEFFREPDLQVGYVVDYFTMGQVLSVPMILGGLVLIIYAKQGGDRQQTA